MSNVPPSGGESPRAYALSLTAGGALYRLLVRARLSGSELEHVRRRIIAVLVVTWAPLLLLSVIDATAWSGVAVPFLADVGVHARLLISVPLLIFAEIIVHRNMRATLPLFVECELFDSVQREQYAQAIASAQRWLASVGAELVVLGLVAVACAVALTDALQGLTTASLPTDAWHSTLQDGRRVLTPAGWWAALVSLPLAQFLLLRWYFRLVVWWQLLWRVARIGPRLQPLHPDRMGGLGFMSRLSLSFTPLLLAQGAMVSGVIANQILHSGAELPDFKVEIVAMCVVMAVAVAGPLCFFAPNLSRAKGTGMLKHEALTLRYARDFDRKWFGATPPDEPLLGNSDVQTLADLESSYEPLRSMRTVPLTNSALMRLVIAFLLPLSPLLLTMFSLRDLVVNVVMTLL